MTHRKAPQAEVARKGKPPAFQFYAKDFLTGVVDMSLIEIGAYAKLLAISWDKGPIPTDEKRRANMLGVPVRLANALWRGIGNKWTLTDDGYVNDRLEQQRASLEAYRELQSERGRRSGHTRRSRTGDEPALNHGSTGVRTGDEPAPQPDTQPETNSPISDLRSANPLTTEQSTGETRAREIAPVWHPTRSRQSRTLVGSHTGCYPTPKACARGVCLPGWLGANWLRQFADPVHGEREIEATVQEQTGQEPMFRE